MGGIWIISREEIFAGFADRRFWEISRNDMREADILLSIEIPQLSILICSTLSNLMNGSTSSQRNGAKSGSLAV